MKKTEGSRFVKTSMIYLLGSLLSKLALVFMLPVYTARIPAGEMGIHEAAVAVAVLISSVIFLDIGVGILRFFVASTDEEEGESVLRTGLFLLFFLSLAYLLVGGAILFLAKVHHAVFALLYGLLNALFLAGGMIARARGCAMRYALAGVVSTFLQIPINLVLILGVGLGVEALYISYIVGASVGVIMLLSCCRVRPTLRPRSIDFAMVKKLAKFCLPLGVSAAAYWLLCSFGCVAATFLVGEEAGGAFAISLDFSHIIVFASFAFRLAWQELAFAKGENPDAEGEGGRYYSAKADLFLRITFAVGLVLIPLSHVVLTVFPRFIGPAYAAATDLIPLALVGAALTVFCDFLEPMFGASGKTGKLFATTAVGAILNVGLIFCFVPFMGVSGVHLAFIVAMFVTVLLRVVLLRRTVGLVIRARYVALLPLVAFALFAYLHFSPLVNLFVFIGADLFGAALLLPELIFAIKTIKRAKA